MSAESQLDLREITALVKAATIGLDSSPIVGSSTHLAFGTEAAHSISPIAADAAVQAALKMTGPPPPVLTGIDTIKLALRAALRLEFATIPLYLTAMCECGHPI